MSSAASVADGEAAGFASWATRVVLSGTEDEFLEIAATNLSQLTSEPPSSIAREGSPCRNS